VSEHLPSRFPLQINAIDGDELSPEAVGSITRELRAALGDAGAIRVDDLPADEAPEGTRGLDLVGAALLLISVVDTAEAVIKVVKAIRFVAARLAQLRSPGHDAEALTRVLGDPAVGGFEVDLLHDADERTIRRRIAAFFADRDRDDLLVLHFSCHGVKDTRGRLHLAARDTDLSLLGATALPAAFVNDQIAESQSQRVVLILDCCYSGAFTRGASVRGDGEVAISDEFGAGSGRIVLTASKATEYSFEGNDLTKSDGRPSAFTGALVTGLETGEADLDADGEITVDELYDYVYRSVRASTPGQAPLKWSYGAEGGLVIAKSRRTAALPAQTAEDLLSTRVPLRLEAVKDLARLLGDKRQGLRNAAASALKDLRDHDDSATVRKAAADALDGNGPPSAAAPALPERVSSPATSGHVEAEPPAPQPVPPDRPRAERPLGVLRTSGWLAVLSVLFGALGMAITAGLGHFMLEYWADRWLWIVELAGAIMLLSTRRAAWGGLLVGALTWEWLWLPVYFHSYLLEEPWGIFLLAGNLLGIAALACAVVALAPRWSDRSLRVRLSTVIIAVLSLAAMLMTAVLTATIFGVPHSPVLGTVMEVFAPDSVQFTWWFAAAWAAAVLPTAALATEHRRAVPFLAVGWFLGGAAIAVQAAILDSTEAQYPVWILIPVAAVTAYLMFRTRISADGGKTGPRFRRQR
jgi:uncharacterized caspase-like protein